MRLDLFLKASRLSPGRTLAQKLCDAGLVSINHQPAKSAHAVKSGDYSPFVPGLAARAADHNRADNPQLRRAETRPRFTR